MISFEIFNKIELVEPFWKSLIDDDDLHFYQTYSFNKICYNYRRSSFSNIIKHNVKCFFIVMFENEKPVCIAPLVLDIKPYKTLRLLGYGTNAGLLDFIYSDSLYVEPLYNYCKKRFSDCKFEFHFVFEGSPLCICMKKKELFLNYSFDFSGFDDYFMQLSKSVKQNIRTAYNRVKKDGKLIRYECIDASSRDFKKILDRINDIYLNRKIQWNNGKESFSFFKRCRVKKRDVIWTCLRKLKNVKLHIIFFDNEIAAFFVTCVSGNHYYIPRLAMNDSFSRYSPGILLIMEFLKCNENICLTFDLGRGAESYKTNLNGVLYKSFVLVD